MNKDDTLADVGELALIEEIRRRLPKRDDVLVGAGDDCAVVKPGPGARRDLLLTSDAVIEDVHFKPGTPVPAIGRKATGRVLSDIAAMGGRPGWALVNICAPPDMAATAIEELYAGALALATEHSLAVVGGDIAEAAKLALHVFAVGYVPSGRAVLRSGARPGDILYVTGTLGGSGAGKHISFDPRVGAGIFLREHARAMIDVSDGLASDLAHICRESGVGGVLNASDIPVDDSATSVDQALYDGEDFELLFTVAGGGADAFETAWSENFELPCTRIGHMTDRSGVIDYVGEDGRARPLDRPGFTHF